MELLAEILFEVYAELMFLIIPEKNRNKKFILISKIIAVLVFLDSVALVIWGIVLLEDNNPLGIAPIVVAAVISLAQIIAGIVLYMKHAAYNGQRTNE